MSKSLSNIFNDIFIGKKKGITSNSLVGFEKECLRFDGDEISLKSHPAKLGSALFSANIKTDFSEAQIEFVTPPISDNLQALNFLRDTHHFVYHNIEEEFLWPLSIPPFIENEEKIIVANYGASNLGQFKKKYREGLAYRYGKYMQAICGVHYNYSLPGSVFKSEYLKSEFTHNSEKELRSKVYFYMLRNVFRMNWLILYLFGASPIISKNFVSKDTKSYKQIKNHYYLNENATSLRMSDIGYQNSKRSSFKASLNSIDDYISDIQKATKTISSKFISEDTSLQLNQNILQIEDEYYDLARAKSTQSGDNRLTAKLKKGGVDYIELRSLDLNPFSNIGIDIDTANFLEIFMVMCLIKPSEQFDSKDIETIIDNDRRVSANGRDKRLNIIKDGKPISLKSWGEEIFEDLKEIAKNFDSANQNYTKSIRNIEMRLYDSSLTLSSKIVEEILDKKLTYKDFGDAIGEEHRNYYMNIGKSESSLWNSLSKNALDSIEMQNKIEVNDKRSFSSFLEDYYSA